MTQLEWEFKRDLRIEELLKISDRIQALSVKSRSSELEREIFSAELNSLQIKIGEIIGKLWNAA